MVLDKILKYLNRKDKTLDQALLDTMHKPLSDAMSNLLFPKERDKVGKLHMSSAGNCARQTAYGYHGYPINGKELDARSQMNFFMGHTIEAAVVALALASGVKVRNVGNEQEAFSLKIKGVPLSGHPDGDLYEDEAVLEVKSMSTFGFKGMYNRSKREWENGFLQGCISDSYKAQANEYMAAKGYTKTCFIGIEKSLGLLHEVIYHKDEAIKTRNHIRYLDIIESDKDRLPEPEHEVNDKGFYPWFCVYCAYHGHCKPNAKKVVISGAYKLKETKEKV